MNTNKKPQSEDQGLHIKDEIDMVTSAVVDEIDYLISPSSLQPLTDSSVTGTVHSQISVKQPHNRVHPGRYVFMRPGRSLKVPGASVDDSSERCMVSRSSLKRLGSWVTYLRSELKVHLPYPNTYRY